MVYAHEYYYLLLAKKTEIAHEMRRLNSCREQGVIASILSYFLKGLYSSYSFKEDECTINEDYLYIDAAFKINPLMPVFTIIPKLFTKTLIILFENSAIAFKKFSSQLPIFHVYPLLIIFLGLLIFIIKLFIDRNVELKRIDQQLKLKLIKLGNGSKEPMMIKNRRNDAIGQVNPSFDVASVSDQRFIHKLRRTKSLDFIPRF